MTVDAADIGRAVYDAVTTAAVELRPDVLGALRQAAERERSERGRAVLRQLIESAEIAAADRVPVCQDTGTAWVWVELGVQECLAEELQPFVDAAVARAYKDAGLRASVVRDALVDRTNTGDNTPAFLEVTQRSDARAGARVHVMLKGGGSDNASVVRMLDPADGLEGVRRVVLDAVEAKASAACPPLVVAVAVGATFDKVAAVSKKALLRPVGLPAEDPRLAEFEEALLRDINALGIGPAGLGGDTTALAVHVASAPCHIAALPVAVNLGCCAMRSVSVDVG